MIPKMQMKLKDRPKKAVTIMATVEVEVTAEEVVAEAVATKESVCIMAEEGDRAWSGNTGGQLPGLLVAAGAAVAKAALVGAAAMAVEGKGTDRAMMEAWMWRFKEVAMVVPRPRCPRWKVNDSFDRELSEFGELVIFLFHDLKRCTVIKILKSGC